MFFFFPGNYMWSQAVLRILTTGGATGEVARVIDALQQPARNYDYAAWFTAWRELGDHLWRQGEWELSNDHPRSARESFMRSCSYYQWGISYLSHTDPRKTEYHHRSIDAFSRYASLCEPPVVRVEVPYESSNLPAWFVPGRGGEARKPAIIFMPGLESTKEQGVLFALAVAERGFSMLLADGPGVGEAMLRGFINRHDSEVPGKATFDYLAARPDVDASRIVAVGLSLGGYRAPRFAAFEPRLAGCLAWGGVWDYGEVWEMRRRKHGERGAVPIPHEHMLHVFGAETLDEVSEKLRAWNLEGVAERIRCPLLVMHGGSDAQTPVEQAWRLYERAGSEQKELKIFTDAEGGSAHCQNDNRLLAHSYMADWLEDVFVQGRQRRGVTVGWERKE